jgi:hypothetical protein
MLGWRRKICFMVAVRVCLKNIAGDENSRFWVLTERPFSGNNGACCPKKTRKAGFKRCIFSLANVFQTHSIAGGNIRCEDEASSV